MVRGGKEKKNQELDIKLLLDNPLIISQEIMKDPAVLRHQVFRLREKGEDNGPNKEDRKGLAKERRRCPRYYNPNSL